MLTLWPQLNEIVQEMNQRGMDYSADAYQSLMKATTTSRLSYT